LDTVYNTMGVDKKKAGGKLRFIVARDLGDVIIVSDVPPAAASAALASVLE
jgi:3-dehydroquinate synthetase